MAENLKTIETVDTRPFKKLIMTIGELPTSFVESMTYYELLAWFVNYLQETIIPTVNNNAEAVEELQNLFINLKDYVDHYFENLDVQENINQKLDSMAASGELGRLMERYIRPEFDELQSYVNTEIADIRDLVERTSSAAPKPVNSLNEMVDTSKTYVLIPDGYWYYWNGTTWTQGGLYQATMIANRSISPNKVTFSKRSENLIDILSVNNISCAIELIEGNYVLSNNSRTTTLYVPITSEKQYTFIRNNKSANRFIVGFTIDEPNNGVRVFSRYAFGANEMHYTMRAPVNATYAVIYYQNGNVTAPYTLAELPEYMCIIESDNTNFISSYILDINGKYIEDGSIQTKKLDDYMTKDSKNLFDYTNYAQQGNLSSENNVLVEGPTKRSVFIPCRPDTKYTVLKAQSSRFQITTTATEPQNGVDVLQRVGNNNATKLTITTFSTAQYLNIFYYNSNYDQQDYEEILKTICVTEGDNDEYIPYGKTLNIKTDNYENGSITKDKLNDEIKESILGLTPLQSRSKIYGVQFDLTSSNTKGERIADANGLLNDYVVADEYQLNDGKNDFDSIFPWCEIRRCNLKIENDKKVITYEDDPNFKLDGTNGDVMVEIPKFYSYRKRVGNFETWAITGEPKSEFQVEPAFLVDGKEVDYVYISAYEGCEKTNNSFSVTGQVPKVLTTHSEFIAEYDTNHLQSYDITTFMMMQKLMVIEFGDRNLQNYLGGLTYLPYGFTGDTEDTITAIGPNTVTVPTDPRKTALWIGERIKFLTPSIGGSEIYARYITALDYGNNEVTITYSGTDLSGTINVGDAFTCCAQKTGLTDGLSYHTGRTNYASGNTYESYVNPFRYRYIENVYGNIWKNIAGIKVVDLDYHINYEPNYTLNTTDPNADYIILAYKAPLQDQYGENGAGYIVECGYDDNLHNLMLPTLCGIANGGGENKYFADAFYSKNETPTTEYECCVGGGWDHYTMSGVFCLRAWNYSTTRSHLNGDRPIYRG